MGLIMRQWVQTNSPAPIISRDAKGAKPTTSQVNVGQFQEIFKGYAQRKENLLYIAFSSVLSGDLPECGHGKRLGP